MKHYGTKLLGAVALLASLGLAGCGDDTVPATDAGNTTTTDRGPSGDTGSGALMGCSAYCTQTMANCTGVNQQYADMAECSSYCTSAGWMEGTPGAMSGNTIACRIYHGGVARTDAAMHCPHAGPSGEGVCGSVNFRNDMPAMYTRVDRMGMPAVSTALVASARKNAFNDGDPTGDMSFATDFLAVLTGLHAALDDDLMARNLAPCSMTTLVGGLPQCAGQTYAPMATVASLILPNDVLNINLAADAGFPNGRRFSDQVIDITLGVLLLNLNGGACGTGGGMCSAATLAMVPLNPRANDRPFLPDFPYLALPHAP